jgi:predicted permease
LATVGLVLAWYFLPAALFVVFVTTESDASAIAIAFSIAFFAIVVALGLPLYVAGRVSAVADASARADAA